MSADTFLTPTHITHTHAQNAVRTWLRTEAPARSGDTTVRYWIDKPRGDFYHENYRDDDKYISLIETALGGAYGPSLRNEAREGLTQWHRNVRTVIGTHATDIHTAYSLGC